jgi:putative flippase GtrA
VTEATTFAMVGFVGLGLTDLFIWTFTDFFKIQYLISKLIAVVIVFFWSFGARRYFIYRRLHPKVSDKTA